MMPSCVGGWLRRPALVIVIIVTGCQTEDRTAGVEDRVDSVAIADRQRVHDFWEAFREATQLRLDGDFEAAREAYRRALKYDPGHEDALYYLGNVNLELEDWHGAREAWQRLVAVNPLSSRAYSQLGTLAMCRPATPVFDLEAARSAFERAHEINREETGPTLRLGQLALMECAPAGASAYFDAVTGSNATSLEAHYLRAYAQWLDGHGEDGVRVLNNALEEMGQLPEAPAGGEGDTKTGRTLGPSDEAGCAVFESFFEEMARMGPPHDESVFSLFGELRVFLGCG